MSKPKPPPDFICAAPDRDENRVHVAAAALIDTDGRVLLARRAAHAHQGGLWEFPGGKLEPGESTDSGLARELHEELGIVARSHRPLIRVRHDYPDRSVMLDVHRVDAWDDDPHGREGQPLAWVSIDELADYPMPPADRPIVNALRLPSTYAITPPRIDDRAQFLGALDATLATGVRLLQLRLFDLSPSELFELGREVCTRCRARHAKVLLNGDPDTMTAIGADGLHLNSHALNVASERPVAEDKLLAASSHTREDLDRAAAVGADFALLSPVLPTRSHPDADPLGWEGFAAMVDTVNIPVFALGGMNSGLVQTAWQRGAQGVAGIRGLWVQTP